eukprot:PhM_4_TR17849/c0_g1_i1/m.64977
MDSTTSSKKPADTPFKQQRLAAWQPILSPMYVVGCFILIAVIFIPIGAVVLIASGDVVEVETHYSDKVCTWGGSPKFNDSQHYISTGCQHQVTFTIDKEMKSPVYMYYKLTNFYQNHRRYAKSRSDSQIAGNEVGSSDISDCDPFQSTEIGGKEYKYSPCGLIAWSMFNDSAVLLDANNAVICNTSAFTVDGTPTSATKCEKKGIAWDSDRDKKFAAPYVSDDVLTGMGIATSTNYYLRNGYYNGEPGHKIPLTKDEDLMVWMRTASLPSFRKLWRKINVDLQPGTYKLNVTDRFDISAFSGKKYVVLATTSWIGGKNEFLGVAYIVVGALCFVLAVAFFIKHMTSKGRTQAAASMLRDGAN